MCCHSLKEVVIIKATSQSIGVSGNIKHQYNLSECLAEV